MGVARQATKGKLYTSKFKVARALIFDMTSSTATLRIHNFGRINAGLYRGGQPSDEQFKELAALGIKTVVSLRSGKLTASLERQVVERLGMCFVHFPFTYFNIPRENEIESLFDLLEDTSKLPIFVHCLHGADRTGLMIALYRIQRMNWNLTGAYNEMKSFGFHAFRLPHFKWELERHANRAKSKREQLQSGAGQASS